MSATAARWSRYYLASRYGVGGLPPRVTLADFLKVSALWRRVAP